MYMILWWTKKGKTTDYLDCLRNKDGSIKLFESLQEADKTANNSKYTDDMRVISIEGVSN